MPIRLSDKTPVSICSATCVQGKCAKGLITGGPCDDNNPCTQQDTCQNGTCGGTLNACNDNNPCTLNNCNLNNGNCQNPAGPDGGVCTDNNPCTNPDACKSSACTGGAVPCNDLNPCTTDACSA